MKPEYILLISAGGVFILMFLIYFGLALKKLKTDKRNRDAISRSYSDENLRKMEYDVAFYDKPAFRHGFSSDVEGQVTIDDVLSENSADAVKLTQDAIFSQIEYRGVEEIRGTFNPEK